MKKIFSVLSAFFLALGGLFVLASCGKGTQTDNLGDALSYANYEKASDKSTVVIEGYVQARRTFYQGHAVLYLQDDNGGYFVYNLPCTEEQYNNDLKVGNHIKVKGYKTSWAGEVEILGDQSGSEAEWVKLDGTKTYQATTVTFDTFVKNNNRFVALNDLVVVNTFEEGRNIYYNVTDGNQIYTFCVETYMENTPKTSEVYKTVASLEKGDYVNVKGFAYMYNTPQLHTSEVTKQNKNAFTKGTGVLTYKQYAETQDNTTVTISGYIDAKQSWWNNKATIYLTDKDGAYFIYELPCTQEQYNNELAIGNHIKVTGYKSTWSGETEILGSQQGAEATWEKLDGKFLALPIDYTELLTNSTELAKHMNEKVKFSGLEVVSVTLPGTEGNDIYYKIKYTPKSGDPVEFEFCVESYLTDKTTDVYKAVAALQAGDIIDVTGYLYYYGQSGEAALPNLHTISCVKQAKSN